MSTVSAAPMQEKVALLDEKATRLQKKTQGNYAMKFVCAAMSSTYPVCPAVPRLTSEVALRYGRIGSEQSPGHVSGTTA